MGGPALGRAAAPAARRGVRAIVGGSGVVLALVLPNRLNWRSDSPYLESLTGVANYRGGSGRGRLIQYRNTLDMAAHHPMLGVGPGNWPVFYPAYMSPGDPSFDAGRHHSHQPMAEQRLDGSPGGARVPGALLLLSTLGVILFVGWRAFRKRGGSGEGLAGLALVCTVLAVVVVGSFDAVLLLAVPSLFAWGLFGVLLPPQRELAAIALPDGRRRLLALGVTGAAILFALGAQRSPRRCCSRAPGGVCGG